MLITLSEFVKLKTILSEIQHGLKTNTKPNASSIVISRGKAEGISTILSDLSSR